MCSHRRVLFGCIDVTGAYRLTTSDHSIWRCERTVAIMQSNNSDHELLLRLEHRLLSPEVRHSRDELVELLAENFVEFGSSGRVYDRPAIISELGGESDVQIAITDFRTIVLSRDVILATYRAAYHMADGVPHHSLRSSIWQMTAGRWQMVFHQGTPVTLARE